MYDRSISEEPPVKHWKPYFIENNPIPVWLSKIAPIEIGAITLGFVVICRGVMDEETKRHETIHFQQYLETGFLGFLLLYAWDYLCGYASHKNGAQAYREIRAEKEAWDNDHDPEYLMNRKRWAWLKPQGDPNANV